MNKFKNDPYRIEHAQICLRCEAIEVMERGGLRAMICGKCHKEIRKMFAHFNKHGLYACADKPIPYKAPRDIRYSICDGGMEKRGRKR